MGRGVNDHQEAIGLRRRRPDARAETVQYANDSIEKVLEELPSILSATTTTVADPFLHLAHDLEEHRRASAAPWTPTGANGQKYVDAGLDFNEALLYAGPERSRHLRFGSYLTKRVRGESEYIGSKFADSILGGTASALIVGQAAHYGLDLDPSAVWVGVAGAALSGYTVMERAPRKVRKTVGWVSRQTVGRASDYAVDSLLNRNQTRALARAAAQAEIRSRERLDDWSYKVQDAVRKALADGEMLPGMADYNRSTPNDILVRRGDVVARARTEITDVLSRHDQATLVELEVAARIKAMRNFAANNDLKMTWDSARVAVCLRSPQLFSGNDLSGREELLREGSEPEAVAVLAAMLGKDISQVRSSPKLMRKLRDIRAQRPHTSSFNPLLLPDKLNSVFVDTIDNERTKLYTQILDRTFGTDNVTPLQDEVSIQTQARLNARRNI